MTTSTVTSPFKPKFSTGHRALATLGVVGAAASITAFGTFGTFAGSTSASQNIGAGSVGIDMPYSTFDQPISGMMPGDTAERVATLQNTGSADLGGILMTISAATSNALTTDAANGLRLALNACSVPWTTVSGGPDACGGSQWSVLPSTAVASLTSGMPIDVASVSAGQADYLRATFKLPETADSSFQDLSAELSLQFDGVQRDGKYLD